MGIHSGKFCVIDGVSTTREWSISDDQALQEFVASNTLFGTGNVPGVNEWSGSYNVYGHSPPALPGDLFSFLGYTAPDNDSTGPGLRYSGFAMAESLQVNWNWQGGEIINAQVSFKGHLALTASAAGSEIQDLEVPVIPPVACSKITYSTDGVTFTEWTNLVSAQLTLTNKVQEYVNSSTAIDCVLWKGQKSGPVTWSASVTEQDNSRSKLPKGAVRVFRFYVTATEYFELKWGRVQNFTGITFNRETGAIIQQTVNLMMHGIDPTETTYDPDAIGHVLMPDGEQWWPAEDPGTGTP